MSSRPYELIVFGATGFTGKYTCEHIVSQLPTDLKWAVAGRSESKLQSLVQELKSLNPDRLAPGHYYSIKSMTKTAAYTIQKSLLRDSTSRASMIW